MRMMTIYNPDCNPDIQLTLKEFDGHPDASELFTTALPGVEIENGLLLTWLAYFNFKSNDDHAGFRCAKD